jgi:hypothetical protein
MPGGPGFDSYMAGTAGGTNSSASSNWGSGGNNSGNSGNNNQGSPNNPGGYNPDKNIPVDPRSYAASGQAQSDYEASLN